MLEKSEIKKILSKKKNSQIMNAAEQESRLRFHTDNINDRFSVIGSYRNKFLANVRSWLPKDKFNVFRSLFKYPLISCRLTDEIYSHLYKIKDGVDPVKEFKFTDEAYLQDAKEYLTESGISVRLDNELFGRMKTQVNSIVVVDMPSEQKGNRPEPYFYFVDVSKILQFKENKEGFEWVIYESDDNEVTVIDDTSYCVYNYENGELGELKAEASHLLGECPAKWFWSDKISCDSIVAKHPLSLYLEVLDWYLAYSIMKRNLDLYAPFTIYWGFQTDCNYSDKLDRSCDDGFLVDIDRNHSIDSEGGLVPCPKCNSRVTGVGTFIEVPTPMNGEAALTPPVGKLDIDKNAVEHNSAEVSRLASDIFRGVTGNEYGVKNTEAMNEMQVMSLFESSEQVLLALQKNFEIIETWILETILKLRYETSFESVFISYGTSHYILTPSSILNAYQQGVKNELPDFILDGLQDKYIQSKYRNNPTAYTRAFLLSQIEPFKHLTKSNVSDMYKGNSVSYEDYMVKMNFSALIDRFERELVPIQVYARGKDLTTAIDEIKTTLLSYIDNPNQDEEGVIEND